MKNKIKLLPISLLIGFAACMASCTPDSYSMASSSPNISSYKEGTDFTITQLGDLNHIVLVNNRPNMISRWVYSATNGISNDFVSATNRDTLTLPYGGVYSFAIQYEGDGGLSQASDSVRFTLPTNKKLIVDPDGLWTKLCGTTGTKTWVLDLDSYGMSYGNFNGPLYFYGTYDSWATVSGGVKAPADADSWNYCPAWSSNTWVMPAMDYGTMTFNSSNLHVTAVRSAENVTSTGVFMMDGVNHTMTVKGTSILMDASRVPVVSARGSIKILSMTDNSMQLAVVRDNDPTQNKCLLVYNYIPLTLYHQLSGK